MKVLLIEDHSLFRAGIRQALAEAPESQRVDVSLPLASGLGLTHNGRTRGSWAAGLANDRDDAQDASC